MLDTDDARLCPNYRVCKSYQKSHKMGLDTCSGCAGEFGAHHQHALIISKHVEKLAGMVSANTPETIARAINQAVTEIIQELKDEEIADVEPIEALFNLQYQSLVRITEIWGQLQILKHRTGA